MVTEYGEISVKVASNGGEVLNVHPEFEDLKTAAATAGVPLIEVDSAAKRKLAGTKEA